MVSVDCPDDLGIILACLCFFSAKKFLLDTTTVVLKKVEEKSAETIFRMDELKKTVSEVRPYQILG